MKKINQAALVAAAVGMLATASSASAAQYISKLVYDKNGSIAPDSYGTVTITDGVDPNYVDVKVVLSAKDPTVASFVDTGVHVTFAFNLVDDPTESTVSFVTPASLTGLKFSADGNFDQHPFTNFTDAIEYNDPGTGDGNNVLNSPLEFHVNNKAGITFQGDGNHFTSTHGGNPVDGFTGGWWFSADISAPGTPLGPTYTVAARDFCKVGPGCGDVTTIVGVPEPASWALMIVGFGAAGGMLRGLRRTRAAQA